MKNTVRTFTQSCALIINKNYQGIGTGTKHEISLDNQEIWWVLISSFCSDVFVIAFGSKCLCDVWICNMLAFETLAVIISYLLISGCNLYNFNASFKWYQSDVIAVADPEKFCFIWLISKRNCGIGVTRVCLDVCLSECIDRIADLDGLF